MLPVSCRHGPFEVNWLPLVRVSWALTPVKFRILRPFDDHADDVVGIGILTRSRWLLLRWLLLSENSEERIVQLMSDSGGEGPRLLISRLD